MIRTFSIRQALADAAQLFLQNIFFFVGIAVIAALLGVGLQRVVSGFWDFVFHLCGPSVVLSFTGFLYDIILRVSLGAFVTFFAWLSMQAYKNQTVSNKDVRMPWHVLLVGTLMQYGLLMSVLLILKPVYWLLSVGQMSAYEIVAFGLGMSALVFCWAYVMFAICAVIEGQDVVRSVMHSFHAVRTTALKMLMLMAFFGALFFIVVSIIALRLEFSAKVVWLFLGFIFVELALVSVYKQLNALDNRA